MLWTVDVSSLGKGDKESLLVEAESWQKALQSARAQRGETAPMSGFSIELLEEGCSAIDPMSRLRYEVKKAPQEASGVKSQPPRPTTQPPSKRATSPSGRPMVMGASGSVRPVPAATPAPPPFAPAAVAAVSETPAPSRPPSPVATPAPALHPSVPLVPPTAQADVATPHLASRIIFEREQEATEGMPLTYREYVYLVAPGTSEAAAETLLLTQLELVRASLERVGAGKLVNLGVFDLTFTGKPPVPPLATLSWKDWRGPPTVSFPRHAKPALVSAVPPAQAPIAGMPILAVAPSPASTPPAHVPPLATPEPAIAAPIQARPVSVPVPVRAPEPVAVPSRPPVAATVPSQPPVAATVPSQPPVAATVPSQPPVAATVPSQPPVAAAVPSQPPVAAAVPSQPPVAAAVPSQPPVAAAVPSQPPVAAAVPSQPPVAAAVPSQPPVAGAVPSRPPDPLGESVSMTTQPGVAPPAPSPANVPVGAASSAPVVARPRVRGEDLIADLFEAMHDLHFVRDALEGGEFCLALAMDKLPCQAGIVHLYDIDRRQFLVASTRGSGTSKLLLKRYSDSDRVLLAATRKRRAVVLSDTAQSDVAGIDRYAALGGARSLLVAPVLLHGRLLGAIELVNPLDGQPFNESEGNALTYIAEQFAEFISSHGIVTDPERISQRRPRDA